MAIENTYYNDNDVESCRKHFLKIANDFCYRDSIISRIKSATSVFEIELIMHEARTN